MAHERESFPTLETDSEVGAVLKRRQEGQAALLQNGSIGFSFKDKDNNVILPKLNDEGAIVVSGDPGTCKSDFGNDTDGDKNNKMVLCQIPLTVDTIYNKPGAIGSCFRDTEFEIVLIEDVGVTDVETVLGEFLCGPGQFTTPYSPRCEAIDTSGLTGVIELQLRAININKESKTSGQLSVNEISPVSP